MEEVDLQSWGAGTTNISMYVSRLMFQQLQKNYIVKSIVIIAAGTVPKPKSIL